MQHIYQLKITLKGAKPPIWRRVMVEESATLADLHNIIQYCFAWDDSHMHEFEVKHVSYAPKEFEIDEAKNSAKVSLKQLKLGLKDKFSYSYDFGDNWEHIIELEAIKPMEAGKLYPYCVTGKRAAPVDDCGGIWGYERMIEILQYPSHPEYKELAEWYGLEEGEALDPAYFNLEEINECLSILRKAHKA